MLYLMRLLLLTALFAGLRAHAASVVQTPVGTGAGTPTTTTASISPALGSTVTSGNAVIVGFDFDVSAGTPGYSVTDDKGNTYTIVTPVSDSFSGMSNSIAYAFNLTNAPKTITITVTSTTSTTIHIDATVYEVSGVGAIDVSTSGTNAIGTALLASFTTAAASEFALMVDSISSAATYTQNNGWTQDYTNAFGPNFYFHNILASSGANSMSATSSASIHHAWVVATFKAGGATCTNNFWSSTGAYAIPNGTTGSYWSTTGAFATPNCSTGSYWLKSGAVGAN